MLGDIKPDKTRIQLNVNSVLRSLCKLTKNQDSQPIVAGRACKCRKRINPQAQGFVGLEPRIDWANVSGQDLAVGRGSPYP